MKDARAEPQPLTDPEPSPKRTAVEPIAPEIRRVTRSPRRSYSTGDRELDAAIAALTEQAGARDADILNELLTTSVRLARQGADRGEMKLVSAALREFARAFRLFARYRHRRKVSIFGSARTVLEDGAYNVTAAFARAIVERDWMVITGAGPGIMAAGNEGAGRGGSFGANIYLRGYNQANVFIADSGKLITFRYFFVRKVTFVKESDAFVLLPGGFGTLDEAFELLTLMQTGHAVIRPVVLLEPPGSSYWSVWRAFITDHLVRGGFISPEDMHFFRVAGSAEEALGEIERFYSNYHSMRFIGDRLYLRLRKAPDEETLARLRHEFADLVRSGSFEVGGPAPAEVADREALDYVRLSFRPTHNYARVRMLIDALNDVG